MADRLLIPEVRHPQYRLGRHLNHDPRSLAFRVGQTATPKSVTWERRIPILDQGDLGSCTGNATVGVLGTEPFFSTLNAQEKGTLNEDLAVSIYGQATTLDSYPGQYPPDDTGSDGLSIAKAVKLRGLISGYQHILSIGEAHAAIQNGPFIVGTLWTNDMFKPDARGVVTPSGKPAGGHEYECNGYDLDHDEWLFCNSWNTSWGVDGTFRMSTKSLQYLLSQQGDATPFVPLTAPAPAPQPQPQPQPADPLANFPRATLDAWASSRKSWWSKAQKAAADAYITWRNGEWPNG